MTARTQNSTVLVSTGNRLAGAVRTWELVAWVAGGFAVVIATVMFFGHLQNPTLDPLKSPELKEYKARLRDQPTDEPTKQKIRDLDLQLRARYFRQLARTDSGVYLLLGAAAVFVLAIIRRSACARRLPMPRPRPDANTESATTAKQARWAVAVAGAAVAAFLCLMSFGFGNPLPQDKAQVEKMFGTAPEAGSASGEPDAASADELKRNWPCFRGYEGAGLAYSTNAPASWDVKTGAGFAWKAAVPGQGFNSPLIWDGKVFCSGGDANLREVYCLDLKSGQLTWRQAVTNAPGTPSSPPEIPESTGYAAGSMATDGRRIYTLFANGDLAGLSLDGKVVWSKGFGALKNAYGHATSLATWRDRVIVQLDQGEPEDRKSKLYAVDGRTGKVLWQKDRKVGASWASPVVFEAAGKPQIVALAVPAAIAYSATDGAELWRVELMNGEITPSPLFAGGQVIVASPSDKLFAVRPDGTGDVTKTHVTWTNEDNVPDVTSPVSNGELVFALTTAGMLSCFDLKDGKKQWEHDYEFECHATPGIAGNRLYFVGQKGTAVIVEAARQYKELFRTQLEDAFHASPAISGDKLVLRGVTNIWCFSSLAPAKGPGQ